MGPPDRIPVFPMYDRLTLPGLKIVPGIRFKQDCNWMQIKENPVDPAHTNILHAIPQLRGMDHFAPEFAESIAGEPPRRCKSPPVRFTHLGSACFPCDSCPVADWNADSEL